MRSLCFDAKKSFPLALFDAIIEIRISQPDVFPEEARTPRRRASLTRQAQEEAQGDLIMVAFAGYSPFMEILYHIVGLEQFAVEWAERRDEVLKLYEVLTDDRRKMFSLLAVPAVLAVTYCGNVSPEVVGLDRFEKYVLPHYKELAEILHAQGKLVGVHFDAHTRRIREAIAGSQIDFIGAFTPAPESEMSVMEARAAWPNKVLWINFPSSTHLEDLCRIKEITRQILRQTAPGDRFLVGITEMEPANVWQKRYRAIAKRANCQSTNSCDRPFLNRNGTKAGEFGYIPRVGLSVSS